jgi:beta-galactosidase/beta-glucuronidase
VAAHAVTAPLPREVRERRLSLDGTWEIKLEPDLPFEPIVVPYSFEAPLSGIGRSSDVHEHLCYRRGFFVPDEWAGAHVLLRFGGVDWGSEVHVDGERVGEHSGGYTHFAFDLGELDPSVPHELRVDVHDPADGFQPRGKQRGSGGIWYARTTGIWRPVWVEAVPAAHITGFELEPAVDGTLTARVRTSEPTEVEIRIDGQTRRFVESTMLQIPEPRLWSPEHPELYDVELETASGDVVTSYVAFRSIERHGRELMLNGRARTFCGVLDQGYWPDGGYTAPGDDALRSDVAAAKALGFDLARMHVKVADPRWYGWCDRLGLLVAQDMPSPLQLDTDDARAAFTHELDEIVDQLRGHPCVVMWIVINEDWGEPPADFQLASARAVRHKDPTRLVVDASGWHHRGESDLTDVHDYGDDLSVHRPAGDLPLWLGECGGVSLVLNGQEDFAYKHVASGEELANEYRRLVEGLSGVAGFVWTQLTDVEGELNGLLTHDRHAKASPEKIRAVNERTRELR